MKFNHNQLRSNIERGIPTADIIDETTKHDLGVYVKEAEEASLIAHASLYTWLEDGNPKVVKFSDDPADPNKYVSFADINGNPLFGPWNPENPATDIGIRGANPSYNGIVNPTTVIHADTLAIDDYMQNGAPAEVVDAIAAVAKLNQFLVENVAKPYLGAVARAYNLDPGAYQANFIASQRSHREQILTRVIMYKLVAAPEQRPIGNDGTPLLIREHVDKSSWTVDSYQSHSNLQYYSNKTWHDSGTEVTAFRGAADSYLPTKLPATLHRAVVRDHDPAEHLRNMGIGRIAMPMFISPIHDDARIVQSNSLETHPTELAPSA